MATIFCFFCKSDLKAETATASWPLIGGPTSIVWETFEGEGRMDFFDFASRENFSSRSCLLVGIFFFGNPVFRHA